MPTYTVTLQATIEAETPLQAAQIIAQTARNLRYVVKQHQSRKVYTAWPGKPELMMGISRKDVQNVSTDL